MRQREGGRLTEGAKEGHSVAGALLGVGVSTHKLKEIRRGR